MLLCNRSLNVPGGLLSFVVLKGFTKTGQALGLSSGLFAPFGVQVRARGSCPW